MNFILDASAMIAALRREPGYNVVEAMLLSTSDTCIAHALNLCEVCYDFHRHAGEAVARATITDLLAAGVVLRDDLDVPFWQEVGNHKAVYRRICLADCCGLALAERVGGEFVTGDHHEFDAIAALGVTRIRFFR